MPSGLIENDHGVGVWRDVKGDFLELHGHRFTVAGRHYDADRFAFQRADRPEEPGWGSALIPWCARSGAALGPAPGQLGLLADPRLVLPPQLYRRSLEQAFGDACQTGGEAFLETEKSALGNPHESAPTGFGIGLKCRRWHRNGRLPCGLEPASAGYLACMIHQSVQERPDVVRREAVIVRSGCVSQMATVPFPIGTKDLRQAFRFVAFVAKTAGIGIGQRSVDMEPNVAGAPVIGKAHIEQMRYRASWVTIPEEQRKSAKSPGASGASELMNSCARR